jgi:hypothetical protein
MAGFEVSTEASNLAVDGDPLLFLGGRYFCSRQMPGQNSLKRFVNVSA